MAYQSTPTVVDFECQTTVDLTILPRTAIGNGCRAYVAAAGATHGLWCLDNQNSDPVGPGVVATSDGVGRWIYYGPGLSGASGMLAFLTLVLMAAAPGPAVQSVAWQEETDAPYLFVPGDVTAVDGVTSIAPTGGTAGRWLLGSDRVSIAPIGGGADDWPRLNTIMAACAYKARIYLRESPSWTCATPGVPTSGTYLETGPGTTITSQMASGTFTKFVFGRFFAAGSGGVLAGIPAIGGNQFLSSASIPVGTQILVKSLVANTFLAQRYTTTAVAAAGPNFTITVERAILFPFAINDAIATISTDVRDITLIGNGATIKPDAGVNGGDRGIELEGGFNVHVKRWIVGANATGASFVDSVSLDLASLWSTVEDVHVQASNASNGIMLESAERCGVIRSGGDGVGYGITIFDSVDCFAQDSHGSECGAVGLRLDSNGVTNVGCKDIRVTGGVFSKGGNDGRSERHLRVFVSMTTLPSARSVHSVI